ncbi:MAG: LptF/LptG family permease [Kiritimatiellae bacterium]|nr:LptF/LptG family permease [Kiritimatiellia bacterium]
MKTLERYVFGSFLSSFLLSFLVLTFVLTIGLMVQIVGFILDGVSASLVGQFALVSFPETMQWTMPLALLVSSVLVFSRMSADSEIAAMRSCGVNLLSVMKWPAAFALFCALLGVFINNEIVPRGHEVRRSLKNKVSVDTGIDVLEPGRVIDDFPKMKLYIGAKEGNWLYDIVVMDYSQKVDRMITASKALVKSVGTDIHLDLYQMTVDPLDAEHPTMARANRFPYVVKDAIKEAKYTKKDKDLTFAEMLAKIASLRELVSKGADGSKVRGRERMLRRRDLSKSKTELSKRFVFAAASLCFVLVGVPLGIKAQRKESSVGMAISLAISLGYYMVVILMLSLQKNYSIHPEMLIWLPVAACFALAACLVPRNL